MNLCQFRVGFLTAAACSKRQVKIQIAQLILGDCENPTKDLPFASAETPRGSKRLHWSCKRHRGYRSSCITEGICRIGSTAVLQEQQGTLPLSTSAALRCKLVPCSGFLHGISGAILGGNIIRQESVTMTNHNIKYNLI